MSTGGHRCQNLAGAVKSKFFIYEAACYFAVARLTMIVSRACISRRFPAPPKALTVTPSAGQRAQEPVIVTAAKQGPVRCRTRYTRTPMRNHLHHRSKPAMDHRDCAVMQSRRTALQRRPPRASLAPTRIDRTRKAGPVSTMHRQRVLVPMVPPLTPTRTQRRLALATQPRRLPGNLHTRILVGKG